MLTLMCSKAGKINGAAPSSYSEELQLFHTVVSKEVGIRQTPLTSNFWVSSLSFFNFSSSHQESRYPEGIHAASMRRQCYKASQYHANISIIQNNISTTLTLAPSAPASAPSPAAFLSLCTDVILSNTEVKGTETPERTSQRQTYTYASLES